MQAQYLLIMSENQSGCLHEKIGHDAHNGVLWKYSLDCLTWQKVHGPV